MVLMRAIRAPVPTIALPGKGAKAGAGAKTGAGKMGTGPRSLNKLYLSTSVHLDGVMFRKAVGMLSTQHFDI